jgi:iron complex outermembrane receptor protein
MSRNFAQVMYRMNYSKENQLRVLAFYSDLEYKTPGGLTLAQYTANPRAARPSTAFVAGPVAQKARIQNNTLYAGIVNEAKIVNNLRHVIALYGSTTDYLNPFITNYEIRKENTAGVRTYLELSGNQDKSVNWKWNAGLELQSTGADIANYNNNRGVQGSLQAQDDIISNQFFYFTRFSTNIGERLSAEVAASLNYYKYKFSKNIRTYATRFERKFDPELMPRLALSYKLSNNLALRSSVSRGYSPPTIAEVRASDNIINPNIESETGWNYEAGLRLRNNNDRLWLDASIFQYKLENAIVRRVNSNDTEYYLNAGGTRQNGIETQASYWLIEPGSKGLLSGLQLQNSYTLSKYFFQNYVNGAIDYSGNRLTGTPRAVVISGLDFRFQQNFYLFAQHNYTSKIALNDANSVFSKSFDLVHFKAGWRTSKPGKPVLDVFAGIDNLLDQTYSLGNDLNAFGGRFFNAAAPRNFFAGMKLTL